MDQQLTMIIVTTCAYVAGILMGAAFVYVKYEKIDLLEKIKNVGKNINDK